MNIAVIGASGRGGSRIVAELVRRGHKVTAIARHPETIEAQPNVTTKKGDLNDPGFPALLSGHDAVVTAVHFQNGAPEKLLEAVRASGVKRYFVMGGAGSLEVAPGVKFVDAPGFPEQFKDEALRGSAFLDRLRREKDVDWTFLSPPALIDFGERTGQFRLGKDQLLVDAGGGSKISFEDFAIATVDELETPKHSRQRFTIGY